MLWNCILFHHVLTKLPFIICFTTGLKKYIYAWNYYVWLKCIYIYFLKSVQNWQCIEYHRVVKKQVFIFGWHTNNSQERISWKFQFMYFSLSARRGGDVKWLILLFLDGAKQGILIITFKSLSLLKLHCCWLDELIRHDWRYKREHGGRASLIQKNYLFLNCWEVQSHQN